MKRLLTLTVACLAACQGQSGVRQEEAGALERQRIEAVEGALQPSVLIRGEPVPSFTLTERMQHYNVPGVSIAVIHDGVIEWARGYGMADVEEGRPVTPQTLFQAGSISKPVAAVAALEFVENGQIDLDADVNEYLTSWRVPANGHTAVPPVTLRRLLTHTAGLTVHGFPGYSRDEKVPSAIGVLDGEGNTDPIRVDIEPGSDWRYSGGGYTVMQLMVSDLVDEPFPQIVSRTVLEPLGMTQSTFEQPLPDSRWDQAATGYRSDGSEVEGKWHVYPEMAAAGLWTTPSDIARFAIGIQTAYAGGSQAVLSKAMAEEMLTPTVNDWGLGPAISGDGRRFGHGGANEGFRNQFTAFIREGRGVAVMTNSDRGGALAGDIVYNVARAYDWPGFEPIMKTVVQIDRDILQEYAGRYEIPDFGSATVELGDGRLWATVPGAGRIELLPESDTVFFQREDATQMTFIRQNGRVIAFEVGSVRAQKVE